MIDGNVSEPLRSLLEFESQRHGLPISYRRCDFRYLSLEEPFCAEILVLVHCDDCPEAFSLPAGDEMIPVRASVYPDPPGMPVGPEIAGEVHALAYVEGRRITARTATTVTTPIANITPNLKRRMNMITVKIHPRCLEQIRHWVALAKGEVSALGIVEKNGEDLTVPEIFLPKQICSGANTDMDLEDVARIMLDLEGRGIDATTLRLWLHSHADMKCFWSEQDNTTIEGLCNDGFVVSIVTNKGGDIKCRVDLFEPFRHTFHDVKVEPLLPDYGLYEECRKEIEAKVTGGMEQFLPDRFRRDALLLEDLFDPGYLELEQKLNDGEMTMQEYLAAVDRAGGFV